MHPCIAVYSFIINYLRNAWQAMHFSCHASAGTRVVIGLQPMHGLPYVCVQTMRVHSCTRSQSYLLSAQYPLSSE